MLISGCGLLSKPKPLTADVPVSINVTNTFAQGVIPKQFTCYGAGQSPPIYWTSPPAHTQSLAVVVDDSDAPIAPRVYWIAFDISPLTSDLQIGALPPHARVAQNSNHEADYDPPCPVGSPHWYRFTVYALNTYFGQSLPNGAPLLQAWTAIARHVIARGTMMAKACPNSLRPDGSQCAIA
jgi:Raf kinase inhibitor-like YbhB/YbcL family protein